MQRQAATPIGLVRRIRDLELGRIREVRCAEKVKHGLEMMMTALVVGVVTMARSLRAVEQRTEQVARQHVDGALQGIKSRIADNTFTTLLTRLAFGDVVKRLHALIKAEHRRGNLEPVLLPIATAAIDGKNVATLRWHDLCRVFDLDPPTVSIKSIEKVRQRLVKEFPNVQLCVPKEGEPYALARVHTVTLISSNAAPCIHQRPIRGDTNEIGSMPALLKELHALYGRTSLLTLITTDAGNTSLRVGAQIVGLGWNYFSQIKSEHGEIHREAERALGRRRTSTADFSYSERQKGALVTYHVWQYDLSEEGWLDWTHARQLVRVQRTVVDATGKETIGNRYYVSSLTLAELGPTNAATISRGHWRCEEETHWTSDAQLNEDLCRLSWSRHPNGVFVVHAVRMIGLAILAVARKLSRLGYSKQTPTWRQVAEHFLLVLCASTLQTESFDALA
jgi:hypothetical protein